MSGVLIKLDRERKLKYNINSLSDFEELMGGVSVLQIATNPMLMSSFRVIRAFVWAGLKWDEFKLSVDKAGVLTQQYIDNGGTVAGLADSIKDALMASGVLRAPEAEAEEAEAAEDPGEGNAPEVTE